MLDLTHVLAGPFAAYQLAVLGADVIKVEPVNAPDATRGRGLDDQRNAAGLGLTYETQGGNKRAIALDLEKAKGAEVLRRLIADSDVFLENYRVQALAALGFGYDAVQQLKPDIIYCSLTGFGQRGPRASVNAYDNVIQAASGIMARSGDQKTAASYVDYSAGMNAAFAIAAALFRRGRDGKGTHIDCAMLDCALMLAGPEVTGHLSEAAGPEKPAEAGIGCYDTADGKLMLGAFNFRQNKRLWDLLDEPALAALETWPDLWGAATVMRQVLARKLLSRSAQDWMNIFHEAGIPAERVRGLDEALADPQLAHRRLLQRPPGDSGRETTVPVAAFDFLEDGPRLDSPAPAFGEHTDEILKGIGYSSAEIDAFRSEGAVA
ncbi:CaiB/BaiF CoA-transferase family protein [Pelagibius sp. CAU 1746]|uniref:CaiB/BaiF CoA transferase family protein n=1 Tax=Pelagibius sp. CAU 1746 TaxID=3140370 RepID=UPI00325B0325